jgi:hypothetical protein
MQLNSRVLSIYPISSNVDMINNRAPVFVHWVERAVFPEDLSLKCPFASLFLVHRKESERKRLNMWSSV